MVRRKSPKEPSSIRRDKSSLNVLVGRNKATNGRTRALREIRHFRNSVKLLIPKANFSRVVREIMMDIFPRYILRISSIALEALQEAAEAYLVQFFEDCLLVTAHAKRKTLMRQDMVLIRRLKGRDDVINR